MGGALLRVCMVGYGRVAGAHSECLRRVPGVEMDTLIGLRHSATEAFARKHGYAHVCYHLADALRRRDLDVVILCTPSPQHAEQTELALRAGKHVLCEIPLALSVREAHELGELAESLDLRLMVCQSGRSRT